jgi:hypothetical protein
MATGFRNIIVYKKAFSLACEYIPKEIINDFNKRSEEIRRLFNHTPDKSGLKSINNLVFRLPTVDCGLPTDQLQKLNLVSIFIKKIITKSELPL